MESSISSGSVVFFVGRGILRHVAMQFIQALPYVFSRAFIECAAILAVGRVNSEDKKAFADQTAKAHKTTYTIQRLVRGGTEGGLSRHSIRRSKLSTVSPEFSN
jgi:hypothetical protein